MTGARLEKVAGENWREFVDAPIAVLLLGKSDCEACASWSTELEEHLVDQARWEGVRFGKIFLDQPGMTDFKRANPWLADVDTLPFTQIYVEGERSKSFVGAGVDRLERRLEGLIHQ